MSSSSVPSPCSLLRHLLALLVLGMAMNAVAMDDDPVQLVQRTTGELFARVHAERETLRADPGSVHPLVEQVLLPHVDLEQTSRLVLGKHWRRASQPQRDDFMSEFRLLLLRTYATAVIEFADVSVEYLDTRYSEDRTAAIVRTRVNLTDGRPAVSIDYRTSRDGDAWKLYDVTVEGVSLVTTYRSSFGEQVGRIGIDGLVQELRARNRESKGA